MDHINKSEMAACAEVCLDCVKVCGETISASLTKSNLVHKEIIECLMDCMAICQTSATLLMRASPNHMITCRAVAEMTERCARSCETIDDPTLQSCAEECRGCSASCQSMLGEEA